MNTLLLIVIALLILGPLRRPLLRHWTVFIPAIIAGVAAFALGSYVVIKSGVHHPVAALIPYAMAAGAAFGAGPAAKLWFDGLLGKQDQNHDRRRD